MEAESAAFRDGDRLVIRLAGGTKKLQQDDIRQAKGRAILRNYINATIGFRQLQDTMAIPSNSLMPKPAAPGGRRINCGAIIAAFRIGNLPRDLQVVEYGGMGHSRHEPLHRDENGYHRVHERLGERCCRR